MRTNALSATALAVVVAVGLTGCIGGPPVPPVAIEELAVPDSLVPASSTAELSYGLVARSESLPWIAGGGVAAPGEPARATVWTSDDGVTWSDRAVGTAEGSFSGVLAGSATLAALAGTVWNAGRVSSVLHTSVDGVEWEDVALPADLRDEYRLWALAVTGDVVYAIAENTDGDARGIRVDGGDVAAFELPQTAEGELLRAESLAANGDDLMLLATTGAEGTIEPTVSYHSPDGGRTWGEPVRVTDALGFVAGVAAADEGFVATGGVPRDDGGTTTAAAWFTADGASWTVETVPGAPEDGPLYVSDNADIWLSSPLADGGVVAAVFANENAAVSGVYVRQPGGTWSMAAQTSANAANGMAGGAMPAPDGSVVVSLVGSHYARLGVAAGGGWTDTAVLAAREDVFTVDAVYPADDTAAVTSSRSTFTVDAGLSWRNATSTAFATLSGGVVEDAPWDPPRMAALSGVRLASSPDGAQLAIGTFFGDGADRILAEGAYRASAEGDWTPLAGFDASGATFFAGAGHVGGTWVAYGNYRDSSLLADSHHGLIWTSADGVTWTRGAGDFGSGVLESSILGVCGLPDGGLVGVGWSEESPGEYRTAVWALTDGSWQRVDIGDLGARPGYANSCATGEDGIVLSATVATQDILFESSDGATWTEVFRAGSGITIGSPVAVDGGFAASGSMTTSAFSGPVVWLSGSGDDWAPVAIPSHRDGATGQVAPLGDDLIVTLSGRVGSPVSIVRDIGAVIAARAG